MNPPSPAPDERELEALSRQLRALAQHLVHDSAAAEDLVQEAWLAALNRPPEQVAGLGAWLRVVLRNLAARRARREFLRQDAEWVRADREGTRETEELLERSNVAVALRQAASELAEPVRSVIALHYFEGLSMEATAARLGRPLETVRTQRRRGIEALRGVLDRRHRGARRDWLAALAPLLGFRRARAPKWRWAALAALASLVLVGVGVWLARATPTAESAPVIASVDVERPAQLVSGAEGEASPRRADVAPQSTENAPPAPSEPPPTAPVETRRFAVRVSAPDGAPVAGARLDVFGLDGAQLGPFTTDSQGRAAFELRVDKLSYRASFAARGGVVVHAYGAGRAKAPVALVPAIEGEQELELQLGGPSQSLSGVVLDPDGAPIAGAHLELDNQVTHMSSAPGGVLLFEDLRRAVTDASGRFLIEHLPRRSHRWVARARNLGLATGAVEGPAEVLDVTIALPRGVEIAGVVRTASGAPAASADVWVARGVGFNLLAPRARTDEGGRYRLLGLTESPVRIFVRAGAGLDESADALHAFANGVERSELDFDLTPRPPLEFRCLASGERPAPGGTLVVETEPGAPAPWRQSVSTDAEGRARCADYPSGPLLAQFLPVGAPGAVLSRAFDSRVTTTLELRVQGLGRAASSAVRVALVDPWHSPIQARLMAVSSADSSALQADFDPGSGVLERLELPAGERHFFVVDEFGASVLGSAQLDGISGLDLGLHTLGPTRAIAVEWTVEGGADLVWVLLARLSATCGYERLSHFAHGRTECELRDGDYQLVGRTAAGDDRVSFAFTVGDGHPVRVQVR